jgi:hypothetical protein
MPNVTTFETKFSKRMQVVHYKLDVFRALANFEERANLQQGQAVVRPYRSALVVDDYTRGTDATIQTTTDTNETLTVDIAKIVPFSVDDFDALQSNYKLQKEYATDAAKLLGNQIDGKFLQSGSQAALNVVDNALFGGNSGDPITVSSSNIEALMFRANQKLNEQNILIDNRFFALSPQVQFAAQAYYAGRETPDGDKVGMNGYLMTRAGLDLHMSNNLFWDGVLTITNAAQDGDTVTINGVVFTFKPALGGPAGQVVIGANPAASRANLISLINAPGTTTGTGTALSAADQAKLKGISAAAGAGATLVVSAVGKSYIVVSETLTDAANVWSKLTQHNLVGRKGATDLVIQQEPTVKVNPIPKQLGVYVLPNELFGVKTFVEGAQSLVDVKVNTASF